MQLFLKSNCKLEQAIGAPGSDNKYVIMSFKHNRRAEQQFSVLKGQFIESNALDSIVKQSKQMINFREIVEQCRTEFQEELSVYYTRIWLSCLVRVTMRPSTEPSLLACLMLMSITSRKSQYVWSSWRHKIMFTSVLDEEACTHMHSCCYWQF